MAEYSVAAQDRVALPAGRKNLANRWASQHNRSTARRLRALMTEPTTPLMQQYHAAKKQHPTAFLLFLIGDFYELFDEDAILASGLLRIDLSGGNKEKGEPVPMCGVP